MGIISIQDKAGALEKLHGKVNVTYKANVVKVMPLTEFDRIPTGSVAQDYSLGCNSKGMGGIIVGAGNCFVGHNSSGKSTAAARVIAEFQRMCARCYRYAVDVKVVRLLDGEGHPVLRQIDVDQFGNPVVVPLYTITGRCSCYKENKWFPSKEVFEGKVQEKKDQEEAWAAYLEALKVNSFEAGVTAYMDVENTLDMAWLARQGAQVLVWDEEYKAFCPVVQFIVVVPSTGEQAIDIKSEYIKSGEIDLIVVDSVAALTPSVEIESSSEDEQRAQAARLINKAVRVWTALASQVEAETGKRVTRLYIQQWRAGMKPGQEKTMPGGGGQLFAYSTITEFYVSDKESKADTFLGAVGTKSEQISGVFSLKQHFKNRKNKSWPPGKEGSHLLQLMDENGVKGGAIVEYDYVLKLCMALNLIEKNGAKYKFKGKDFTSQAQIIALWQENPFLWRNTCITIRKLLFELVQAEYAKGKIQIAPEPESSEK